MAKMVNVSTTRSNGLVLQIGPFDHSMTRVHIGNEPCEMTSELWETWLADNKDNPLVTEGLVSAVPIKEKA